MFFKKFLNKALLYSLVVSTFLIQFHAYAKPPKIVTKPPANPKKTCSVAYPGRPQCKLQNGYVYSSKNQAMNAMGWNGFKTISPRPSTQGTCRGYSTHWNVRDPKRGSDRVGSIASCDCCDDNNNNPRIKILYKTFR